MTIDDRRIPSLEYAPPDRQKRERAGFWIACVSLGVACLALYVTGVCKFGEWGWTYSVWPLAAGIAFVLMFVSLALWLPALILSDRRQMVVWFLASSILANGVSLYLWFGEWLLRRFY